MSQHNGQSNTSPSNSRSGNRLPPPLSSKNIRADATPFSPNGIFAYRSAFLQHLESNMPQQPESPSFPPGFEPFMPPETPTLPDSHSFDGANSKEIESASNGSNVTASLQDLLARTTMTPSSQARSNAHKGFATESVSASASATSQNSMLSSSRTNSSPSLTRSPNVVSPSPQRHRSVTSVPDQRMWEKIGEMRQVGVRATPTKNFNGVDTIAEEPEQTTISKHVSSSAVGSGRPDQHMQNVHSRNALSIEGLDRGTTPGGVMLPHGPWPSTVASSSQSTGLNVSSKKGPASYQDATLGLDRLQLSSNAMNTPYRPPQLAQYSSRSAGNGGNIHYHPSSPSSGFTSPASAYSAGSLGTQTPSYQGGQAQRTADSPSSGNSMSSTPLPTDAKGLAQYILMGLADDGPTTNKGPTSRKNSRPPTPQSNYARHPYQLPPPVHVQQPPQVVDMDVQAFMMKHYPTLDEVLAFMPFMELCKLTGPSEQGVIKITDIPYSTKRNEIVAFVGRNAKIASQPQGTAYFAIHIIMERQTAKSMDCFVEYETVADAQFASTRHPPQKNQGGRRPRIGDRCVNTYLSSQEALMRELFPRTKCVQWEGQQPIIMQSNDAYNTGFQGFTAGEELVMTVKYSENPNRSRFAVKHPQRAYESMISLLSKYPWWKTDKITLGERDNVFRATRDCCKAFVDHVMRGMYTDVLTPYLLQELVVIALNVPAFSETQRHEIMQVVSPVLQQSPAYITPLASAWPFEVLRKKVDAAEQLVNYYASILQATFGPASVDPFYGSPRPFGEFKVMYPEDRDKAKMTLDQAATLEWEAVRGAIELLFR